MSTDQTPALARATEAQREHGWGDNTYDDSSEGPCRPMKVADLLSAYGPGDSGDQDDPDAWTWTDEFAQLWGLTPEYMADLTNDIRRHGIKRPLLLGNDGRLWNGHHRLAVAVALLMDTVPVEEAS